MQLAPIVVFAFNRPASLRRTIASLQTNEETKESPLYVFVDGPRKENLNDAHKVQEVRDFVKTITGFKSLTYTFAEANKGLAPSIIAGVTQLINEHGKVIVVEDDLVVSRSFLRYMNEMLEHFENDARVMQITGWGSLLRKKYNYPWDAYLNLRGCPWTWATWKDRWETVDWQVRDFDKLKNSRSLRKAFCRGGSDLFHMLNGYMTGRVNSWFIRFNYSMHKQGRYSLCPVRSLAINEGFTSAATNCNAYNRYKIDFEDEHDGEFRLPAEPLQLNERLMHEALRFWSLPYRIYGRSLSELCKLFRR